MKLLKIFLFVITACSMSFAGEGMEDARKSFNENRFDDAVSRFTALSADPRYSSESFLTISLIKYLQNRTDESQEYFRRFAAATPDNEAYIKALITTSLPGNFFDKAGSRMSFSESLAQKPDSKSASVIKAIANESLMRYYDTKYEYEKADKYGNAVGILNDWAFAGVFENISGSGFNKEFGPFEKPQKDAAFIDKNNAEVKWHTPPKTRPGKWIDLGYYFQIKNSIMYAQTFVKSEEDKDLIITAGVSGSIKLWVNDALVISEAEERNNHFDSYSQEIRLKKGWNRILVQMGESETDRCNFAIRLITASGAVATGLTYSTEFQAYPSEKNAKAKPAYISSFEEAYFEDKLKKEPEPLMNYILLAEAYKANYKLSEAKSVLKRAEKKYPQSLALHCFLLQAYRTDENQTAASTELEKIRMLDPENIISITKDWYDHKTAKDIDKLKMLITKFAAFPDEEDLIKKKMELAEMQSEVENIKSLVEEGYAKFPSSGEFVLFKFLIEKQFKGDNNSARKILEKYLEEKYDPTIMLELANLHFEMSRQDEGMAIYDDMLKYNELASGYIKRKADIYFKLADYENALRENAKILAIAPDISTYHIFKGDCHNEMKQKDLAMASYKRALELEPYNYTIKDKLRELKQEKPVWQLFKEPDLYEIYKNSAGAEEKYEEENMVVLWDQTNQIVYPDGTSEYKVFSMGKALNSSGTDQLQNFYVNASGYDDFVVEKAEVLKKNGNRLKAEVSGGQVVFTSLEPGDGVLVIYKVQTYKFGKLARHFWNTFRFDTDSPVEMSQYNLLTSKDYKFSYKMLNSDLKPEITDVEGMTLYSWQLKNQAPIREESYMPPTGDISKTLFLSSIPDWNYISDWYVDLSATKAKSDFEVRETIKEIFEGKNPDKMKDMEKARVIYDYIIKNIRYSYIPFRQSGLIPQKASKVITTKIGDCKDVSTLFVTLAREVGVESHLVLVNTSDNGEKSLTLPSIEFNHCIAKAKLDGKEYYIELTSDLNSFSTVNGLLLNSFYLDIDTKKKSEPGLLDPPTRNVNKSSIRTKISFDDNKMNIDRSGRLYGGVAANYRSVFKDISREEQEQQLQGLIGSDYAGTKITSFKFDESLNNSSDSLSLDFGINVNNPFTKIGGMDIFKVPFLDKFSAQSAPDETERKYPMEVYPLKYTDIEEEVIEILIPADKEIAELPEDVDYSSKHMDYSLKFKQDKNVVTARRTVKNKSAKVAVEDYQGFKKLLEEVIGADALQLGLRKKTEQIKGKPKR